MPENNGQDPFGVDRTSRHFENVKIILASPHRYNVYFPGPLKLKTSTDRQI